MGSPMSMCFYKLVFRTADVIEEQDRYAGKNKITVKDSLYEDA